MYAYSHAPSPDTCMNNSPRKIRNKQSTPSKSRYIEACAQVQAVGSQRFQEQSLRIKRQEVVDTVTSGHGFCKSCSSFLWHQGPHLTWRCHLHCVCTQLAESVHECHPWKGIHESHISSEFVRELMGRDSRSRARLLIESSH